MSDTIVDSSVVAKWILPEPDSTQAQRVLVEVSARGENLLILDIVDVEVTNTIWKHYHRKLITLAVARQYLDALFLLPVRPQPSNSLLRSALEIGAKYDRAIYDALFVALVYDTGLPGVTADQPLYYAVHADFPQIVLLRDW